MELRTVKNRRIVLVDDDLELSQLLCKRLENVGCTVETAVNTDEFIQLLKKETYPPQLCLIDLNLEKVGQGFALIEYVRKTLGNEIPIIVISAESQATEIAHAIELGANDYVLKPLTKSLFLEACGQYLDIEISVSPYYFHKILPPFGSGKLQLTVRMEAISESGIQLKSSNLIKKGSLIYLSGSLIQEITGNDKAISMTILSNATDHSKKEFILFAEFDSSDVETLNSVRKWLGHRERAHFVKCN